MPTRPNGSVEIAVDDDHISVAVDVRPVPVGAAIYILSSNTINSSDSILAPLMPLMQTQFYS